jgi:methylated-DNA-[protein]-cysteine S-methyltransferase
MAGRFYAIFDTAVGRCGLVWSSAGVVAVQLPEARELETRRRIYRCHPDAREQRPSGEAASAIDAIAAALRGEAAELGDIILDSSDIPALNRRVYDVTRGIPRGETRTYAEIAKALGASGASHSVAQAIRKNPFMMIVPCHRVLEAGNYADGISAYGGVISKRRLLSLEGARPSASKTLFDVLLPPAPRAG